MMDEVMENDLFAGIDMLTPEELSLLKELQEKKKNINKNLSTIKAKIFKDMADEFADAMSLVKKVVTVSTKTAYSDGNIYAITFGSDESGSEIDTVELATQIIDKNLSKIEPIMGLTDSCKVQGKIGDEKYFFQIRKR